MSFLICTRFRYTVDGPTYPRPSTHEGSYLGTKPASLQTIRRFLNGNTRKYGVPGTRYTGVEILGSYESQWRRK